MTNITAFYKVFYTVYRIQNCMFGYEHTQHCPDFCAGHPAYRARTRTSCAGFCAGIVVTLVTLMEVNVLYPHSKHSLSNQH